VSFFTFFSAEILHRWKRKGDRSEYFLQDTKAGVVPLGFKPPWFIDLFN
jgi:hypothetical protein